MEGQVFIRCREDDKELIQSIVDEATKKYKEMIID